MEFCTAVLLGLDICKARAYNRRIHGMTENTFSPLRPQESMRLVRACGPRRKYRLPTVDASRPIKRGIKGSVRLKKRGKNALNRVSQRRATRVEPRAQKQLFHARPFISHDGTGVFICSPSSGTNIMAWHAPPKAGHANKGANPLRVCDAPPLNKQQRNAHAPPKAGHANKMRRELI